MLLCAARTVFKTDFASESTIQNARTLVRIPKCLYEQDEIAKMNVHGAQSQQGETALHWAAEYSADTSHGSPKVIRKLLGEFHADPNIQIEKPSSYKVWLQILLKYNQ